MKATKKDIGAGMMLGGGIFAMAMSFLPPLSVSDRLGILLPFLLGGFAIFIMGLTKLMTSGSGEMK